MSKIDGIKVKEVEAAIEFYTQNGLSENEALDKISSHFGLPKEEIKKIASGN